MVRIFVTKILLPRSRYVLLVLAGVVLWLAPAAAISVSSAQAAELAKTQNSETSTQILRYIHDGWRTLTRSTNECASFSDSKLLNPSRVLYLPKGMEIPAAVAQLGEQCAVHIEILPRSVTHLGQILPQSLPEPGLLYLPNPYVVPGGRFNEMYGWDSYFILRGLIEDGELNLARGMVENFFFEIENYGAVLNANRTYYLTRSQPPFLSSMILAVHHANIALHQDDAAWLERAYQYAQRDYKLWMTAPKLDSATGLSRYYDFGSGPVQEIGDHSDYYIKVADWLVKHPEVRTGYLTEIAAKGIGPALHVPLCDHQPCEKSKTVWLTPEFYKGDQAMRESGFDTTFRFGPFGGSTQDFAPVCLNSLLYKIERDLSELATDLRRSTESRRWRQLAKHRKQLINRYLWDSRSGLFEDYNLRLHRRSNYLYASIFYPLWTGLATPAQARAVHQHLSQLEYPGGLAMSDRETGVQWDKPYGWAPIQLIAVEGLRRYGFDDDADRISRNFLTMVIENAKKDGFIREKYNVVNRSTIADVTAGYTSNVVGFGWTNGAFLVLLHELSAQEQKSILNESARADHIVLDGLAQRTSLKQASTLESSSVAPVSRFPLPFDALTIHQAAHPHNPFSVAGETAAILGQQDGSFELWDFPVKVLAHVHLHAELAGDPVPIDVNALAASIDVSPDHTSITYLHAAFTVKQHMFIARPEDGQSAGPIVLFEIASVRPLTLTIQFEPVMQRMWPAPTLGRTAASWFTLGGQNGAYLLNTDDSSFSAMVAMPGTLPGISASSQGQPKDSPLEFKLAFDPKRDSAVYFPLVTSVINSGPSDGEATRLLASKVIASLQHIPQLYEETHSYYEHFFDRRLTAETPDARFDQALRWAEISIDQLKIRTGSELGLVAGLNSSADSARPGFGWFFGRDTLWTLYAVNSYGDFLLTRRALEFLIARQRTDGKIMHEYSQSADKVDWPSYGYEFAAADSTPLFIMVMEDYLRATGDKAFVQKYWENVKRAYQFTRAHNSNSDAMYDNSQGTGWVESWPTGKPKQELYLAALDQQSSEAVSRLALVMGDSALAASARRQAELIQRKLAGYRGNDGIYAFSRNPDGSYDRTSTVFSSVAWWSGNLILPHADKTLDLYASHDLSADWGLRAVAQSSPIYDALSYHQGSVWPLFTGWVSLAEYRTQRPISAYAHLLANTDLTWISDPGNVTELLSGDVYEPLSRSTAHQLWSSAMVLTPAVRGLFGVEADFAHHVLRVAPQLPANWDHAALHNVPFGDTRLEISIKRRTTDLLLTVTSDTNLALCLTIAVRAFAEDCIHPAVTVHTLAVALPAVEVSLPHHAALPGASDCAPRVISQHYSAHKLALTVELLAATIVSLPLRINLAKSPKLCITGAELRHGKLLVKAPSGRGYLTQHIELSWSTRVTKRSRRAAMLRKPAEPPGLLTCRWMSGA